MVDPDVQPLIFDNGTELTKIGYGGDPTPHSTFSTVVGWPRDSSHDIRRFSSHFSITGLMNGAGEDLECLVGDDALQDNIPISIRIRRPVERGVVGGWIDGGWKDMQKIWLHSYRYFLRRGLSSQDHPVVLVEPPLNPARNRETATKIFFETFGVPECSSTLALYASGRTSGVVVESGAGVTHAGPVYRGHCLPHNGVGMKVAGHEIDSHLLEVLAERQIEPPDRFKRCKAVNDLKLNVCYVAVDIEEEKLKEESVGLSEVNFQLPDGTRMDVSSERYLAPEILFRPSQGNDVDRPGIHELCHQSIQKCDSDLREEMYRNIVLAGGSTLFRGLEERFLREIRSVARGYEVEVSAPEERSVSAWLGGSILSSLSSFAGAWMTKDEFDEVGECLVHRACY